MTFDEFWKHVEGLSGMACDHIPSALSTATKNRLVERTPDDVGEMVKSAIEQVNHGSVESLDELISKRL